MKDKTSNDNAFLDEFFLSHIFSYLDWRSLLNCRRVDSTWNQSVAITPVQELFVSSHQIAKNLPEKLAKTFPKLKRLQYDSRSRSSKRFLIRDEFVTDGVVQFRELDQLILRHGDLRSCAPQILQLSHLTHLDVCCNTRLKWNLRDIAKHLPKLETLRCQFNRELVGSLTDLQPLKNSLRLATTSTSGLSSSPIEHVLLRKVAKGTLCSGVDGLIPPAKLDNSRHQHVQRSRVPDPTTKCRSPLL